MENSIKVDVVNVVDYKKVRNLLKKDLKKLPVVKMTLSRIQSESFGTSFKWSIPFGFAHLESRQIN